MCTTFAMKNEEVMLLGHNYDFYYGHGLIVVSTRDLMKESFKADGTKGVRWKTKYGNITFTQFGRELPMNGMNEKGLTIAMMYHEDGLYPQTDSRPALNELQWIQYQLDQYASVEEVIYHLDHIRLEKTLYELHYMIADATGQTAIIEFIEGRAHVTQDAPYFSLTNTSFEKSLAYANQFQDIPIPQLSRKVTSLDRFTLGYRLVEDKCRLDNTSPLSVEEAFCVLEDIAVKPSVDWSWIGDGIPSTLTYWSIVFDIKNLIIHYNDYGNKEIRSIDLKKIDFSHAASIRCLSLDNTLKGSIECHFKPYTTLDNERIIQLSYKPISDVFPIKDQLALAQYPDTFK
ncbi:linear amide C-N hydrolase [Paenibacillus sp. PDC88]|uniref:linear amide C-N hydrolase n=1 Tax=Paenibacillus sp. PDC88 TaxID=1884375 RepID=UPI00089C6F8B|nr:linear amide C-N hydrolase [Paenibacillus sp. PDC88]SDX80471.1 penicillin amidase Cysteine peptidase. MEROPS family C59 [Paenibacillus sp. PDC88]